MVCSCQCCLDEHNTRRNQVKPFFFLQASAGSSFLPHDLSIPVTPNRNICAFQNFIVSSDIYKPFFPRLIELSRNALLVLKTHQHIIEFLPAAPGQHSISSQCPKIEMNVCTHSAWGVLPVCPQDDHACLDIGAMGPVHTRRSHTHPLIAGVV